MTAWDFAVAFWRRPGMEAVCLELQDAHGQCVALLLWRLWALDQRREITVDALARAVDVARAWDSEVLVPLRAVRARLKTPRFLIDEAARRVAREQVQVAELGAERALIDALERLAPDPAQAVAPPLPALIAAAEAWRAPAPLALLAQLAAKL